MSEEASTLEHLNPEGLLTLDFRDPAACARAAAALGAEDAGRRGRRRRRGHGRRRGRDRRGARAAAQPRGGRRAPRGTRAGCASVLAAAGVPSPSHRIFTARRRRRRSRPVGRLSVRPQADLSRGKPRRHPRRRSRRVRGRLAPDRGAPLRAGGRAPRRRGGARDPRRGLRRRRRGRARGLARREADSESLALFDKPDPLDGPFFEETIYVTPSRLPADVAGARSRRPRRAARGALGLADGPVHAELRWIDAAAPGSSRSPRARSAGSARGRCDSAPGSRSRS